MAVVNLSPSGDLAEAAANFFAALRSLDRRTRAIAVAVDCTWALAASRLRGALSMRATLRNRLPGGLFIGAGLGLALARRP